MTLTQYSDTIIRLGPNGSTCRKGQGRRRPGVGTRYQYQGKQCSRALYTIYVVGYSIVVVRYNKWSTTLSILFFRPDLSWKCMTMQKYVFLYPITITQVNWCVPNKVTWLSSVCYIMIMPAIILLIPNSYSSICTIACLCLFLLEHEFSYCLSSRH